MIRVNVLKNGADYKKIIVDGHAMYDDLQLMVFWHLITIV